MPIYCNWIFRKGVYGGPLRAHLISSAALEMNHLGDRTITNESACARAKADRGRAHRGGDRFCLAGSIESKTDSPTACFHPNLGWLWLLAGHQRPALNSF